MSAASSSVRFGQTADCTHPPATVRSELLAGLCYCLLYDLCAWLAGSRWPVPPGLDEYRREDLRLLSHPRERLGRYLEPQLLLTWERALTPFFEAGAILKPRVRETAALDLFDMECGGLPRAQLRFGDSSSVLGHADARLERPARDWLLTVTASGDLLRVQEARLEPAHY